VVSGDVVYDTLTQELRGLKKVETTYKREKVKDQKGKGPQKGKSRLTRKSTTW